jgi:Tfp pilus assembly protein PilX
MVFSGMKQRGAATIVVTVVLLVVMTLMVLFASKIGVFDVRMSANEARYKEAFVTAEAGLDYATQRFASEFKRLYDGTDATTASTTLATIVTNAQVTSNTEPDGTAPEANDPYFTVSIVNTGSVYGAIPIYTFTSTGVGSDGTATSTVQREITMANVFGGTVPSVPVIVGGAVGTGGNFNIVANPDGGGEGIPVSVWSNDDITASSSSASCHFEFYDGANAQCSNPSGNQENITRGTNPATALTTYDSTYPDMLPHDSNFPTDIFNFMFGVPTADWAIKEAEAAANMQSLTSCTNLVSAGTAAGVNYPLWWINGNCTIGGGVIGSTTDPVILVVSDGLLKMSGNSQINGIVYLFDNPSGVATPSAQLSGTTEIVGSFVSDVGGAAMSGSYSVVYDPTIVDSFLAGGNTFNFAYIPASWRDF